HAEQASNAAAAATVRATRVARQFIAWDFLQSSRPSPPALQSPRGQRREGAARSVCVLASKPRCRPRRRIQSARSQTTASRSFQREQDRALPECCESDPPRARERSRLRVESGGEETSGAPRHKEDRPKSNRERG